MDLCDIFRCKVADVSEDTVTIEVSGKVSQDHRDAVASGAVRDLRGGEERARGACRRDSGVDSKLLAAIEDEGDLEFA